MISSFTEIILFTNKFLLENTKIFVCFKNKKSKISLHHNTNLHQDNIYPLNLYMKIVQKLVHQLLDYLKTWIEYMPDLIY